MTTTQTTTRTCCSFKMGDRVMTEYGPGTVHSHWGIKSTPHGYDLHSVHITLDCGPISKFETTGTYAFDLFSQKVEAL